MATLNSIGPGLKDLELTTDATNVQEARLVEDWGDGVEQLLRHLGSQLKRLFADLRGSWLPRPLGALSCCTALTRLDFKFRLDEALADAEAAQTAELDILRSICSLTGLRHLTLSGGAAPPRDPQRRKARDLPGINGLSALTALTHLEMNACGLCHCGIDGVGRDGGVTGQAAELRLQGEGDLVPILHYAVIEEGSALLAAVQDLPSLAVLRTGALVMAPNLAALTSVTSLHVGALSLPPGPVGELVPLALPPQLRQLACVGPLHHKLVASLEASPPPPPEALAAMAADEKDGDGPEQLAPPPRVELLMGCTSDRIGASPWFFVFTNSDLDGEGALLPEAAASMRTAVPVLLRRFAYPDPRQGPAPLRMLAVQGPEGVDGGVRPPPARAPAGVEGVQVAGPDEGGHSSDDVSSHCASWLGSMAAVRPECLALVHLALSFRDMRGLAECMAGLRVLKIFYCGYEVSSLPLLGSMPHLAELHVQCGDWNLAGYGNVQDGLDDVEAAFMGLTGPMTTVSSIPCQDQGQGQSGAQSPQQQTRLVVVPTALPKVQLIKVHYTPSDFANAAELLNRALARPRWQLQQRGGGGELRLVQF